MVKTYALDLPVHLYGYVDRRFLTDGAETGVEPAVWFGLLTPANRALGLTVMLECGAVYRGLPPHAWRFAPDAPEAPLCDCQAWDCFGGAAQVLEYQYLRELPVKVLATQQVGSYLFTLEWAEDGFSRYPGQTKCFHAIELEAGTLTFQPNNHLLWHESSFTRPHVPTWLRRNPTVYGVEGWPDGEDPCVEDPRPEEDRHAAHEGPEGQREGIREGGGAPLPQPD